MALALGYPHPDYLLPYLTSRQLREWIAYNNIEPFGQPEQDLQSAFTRQVMAQTSMAERKNGEGFSIEEMSLNKRREETDDEPEVQSEEEMLEVFKALGAEFKEPKNG